MRAVALGAVLLLPSVAPAAPPGASGSAQPAALRHELLPAPAAAPAETSAALAAHSLQRLRAGFLGDGGGDAQTTLSTGRSERFRMAGDLDRDGFNDLIAHRPEEQIAVLGGADGEQLWNQPVAERASVIGLPVGRAADDGVVIMRSETQTTPVSRTLRSTFTALDGDGEVLWSTEVEGVIYELPSGDQLATQGMPIGLSLADVDGDGATDVRISQMDGVAPGALGRQVSSFVISGADGSVGDTTAAASVHGTPVVEVMPDVNEDGRPEVAVLDLAEDGSSMVALDGRTGETLWSVEGLQQYSLYVVDEYWVLFFEEVFASVGDTTGDGVADLRVLQFDRTTKRMFAAVVDGDTGAVGFTADVVHPLGDVVGDDRAEVGTVTAGRNGGTVEFRYDAMDFEGSSRRSHLRLLDVGDREQRYVWLLGVGDVDSDGIDDLEHDVLFGSGSDQIRDSVLLSGAQMHERWQPQSGWFHPSFDGQGVDHLTVAVGADGQATLTARDGATGTALWSAVPQAAADALDLPTDLDRDGRHELLLDGMCAGPCPGGPGRPLTLLSPAGEVLWQQRR